MVLWFYGPMGNSTLCVEWAEWTARLERKSQRGVCDTVERRTGTRPMAEVAMLLLRRVPRARL